MIFVEIKKDEVEKEVNRLQNIKLKRHDKMKQKNSILIAKKVVKISFVCEQFSLLGKNEKSMFLSFSDSFKYFENKEDSRFSLDIEAIEVLSGKQCFPFGQKVAADVWGIFNTNCFEAGVYNNLSRVNHSCDPNAEFVWNNEKNTQDLRYSVPFVQTTYRQLLFRATKKIKAGQEITATYLDLEDGLNRVYRQVQKH